MKKTAFYLCCLSSFFLGAIMFTNNKQISPAEQAVNNIMEKGESVLCKKYCMRLTATNVAMPRGNIKLLGLDFQIVGPISKEKLRLILVDIAADFIQIVNANIQVHEHLEKDPFGIDSLSMSLSIVNNNGFEITHPDIGVASISRGKLRYETDQIVSNIFVTVTEEEESYEDAIRKLQEEN